MCGNELHTFCVLTFCDFGVGRTLENKKLCQKSQKSFLKTSGESAQTCGDNRK